MTRRWHRFLREDGTLPPLAGADDNAETAEVETTEVETPEVEPVVHPWDKEVAEYFGEEPITADKVSAYLADKRQPYITKLEEKAKELEAQAAWYHGFEEDPEATLAEAVTQLYGEDTAERILELVAGGASAEDAAVTAAAEEADAQNEEVPEWARAIQERIASDDAAKAQAEAEAASAAEQAAAEAEYLSWYEKFLADNPDVKDNEVRARQVHMYVATIDDLDEAVAAFRTDFPAPEKPKAPATAGRGQSQVLSHRPIGGSLADKLGAAYDAARGPQSD